MNEELISKVIKLYLQNIEIQGRLELESYLETTLEELLVEILSSIYEDNKNAIVSISCKLDTTDDYIFKDIDGEYSLDIFLINRLLKNVSSIILKEQYFLPCSHYDADCREILLDAGRFKNLNKEQIKKVVYHEFLHALKTDFTNEQFFQSREYFELKEKIKQKYPTLVNDFNIKSDLPEGIYSVKRHAGLTYCKRSSKTDYNTIDIENIDEMLNEADSIILSKDNNAAMFVMKNSNRILLVYNPESSNVSITNYGFLLIKMLNKNIIFRGQYLEPSYLIDYFNKLYTGIFRDNFNSNDTAWNIFSTIISKIKKEQTEELNIKLLDTIYECVKHKNELLEENGYESELKKDIKELRMKGLIEQNEDGSLKVASVVKYNDAVKQNKTSSIIR